MRIVVAVGGNALIRAGQPGTWEEQLENAREILRNNDQMVPEVCELLRFVEQQQEGKHGRARERTRKAA